MKRIITQEQIEGILQAFRTTNITMANGEAIVKFFVGLPVLQEPKPQPEADK